MYSYFFTLLIAVICRYTVWLRILYTSHDTFPSISSPLFAVFYASMDLLHVLPLGALVFVDEMLFPPPGLKDRSNLIVYNTSNLTYLVDYYLKRPLERTKIARAGYMEALGNHQSYHLIERMLLQVFKSQSEQQSEWNGTLSTVTVSSSSIDSSTFLVLSIE